MRNKLIFAAGAAVGYVLGTRDGRGRYEQIKSQADSLWNDPRVQEKVGTAQQAVKDKAPEVQAKVSQAADDATAAAKNKAQGDSSSTTGTAGSAFTGTTGSPSTGTTGSASTGNLTGAEPGSNYTPAETKFNSAD